MKNKKTAMIMPAIVLVLVTIMATGQMSQPSGQPTENNPETLIIETSTPQVVTMIVTGYSVDRKQCGKTDGITAMGRNGKKFSGVAADNTLLPLGTKVFIPGVGERLVDDTGGDMRKAAKRGAVWEGKPRPDISYYHIDLRFTGKNAKQKALAWGRRTVEVVILPPSS